jgi:hypothetical protein
MKIEAMLRDQERHMGVDLSSPAEAVEPVDGEEET